MLTDIRHGLRMMARSPGFTAIAIVSLALGIGANTAIFSLIHTVLLRPLPVRQPEQLVEFLHSLASEPQHRGNGYVWRKYEHIRDTNQSFTGVTALAMARYFVRVPGEEPETLDGGYVADNFFHLLGVKAAIGTTAGAVVSWRYWNTRFHGDEGIVGRQLYVEDVPVTIAGVAPPEFTGVQVGVLPDLWLPVAMEGLIHHPGQIGAGRMQVAILARLKPGVSKETALAEMKVLDQRTPDEQARVARENPLALDVRLDVESASAGLATRVSEQFRKPLLFLMAIVGLLLLLACTNLASLLLAKGAARQHEMTVRIALGASRMRVFRQVLSEALLLSFAGSMAGLLIAYLGTNALVRILSTGHDRISLAISPDRQLLLFTLGITILTGVLFGTVPALQAWVSAPADALRTAGRAGETRVGRRLGKALVMAQVALSVVLLSAASLFIGNLAKLESLDPGFRKDHVLLVTLNPARTGYTPERLAAGYQELLRRFGTIPGVRSATLSAVSPLSGAGAARNVNVEGYQARPGEVRLIPENWVAPKYFETYGTPLLAGRDFGPQDSGPNRVAIVNRTMARYFFGNGSPVGKHVTFDGDPRPYEVIGVAGDAKYEDLQEATWRTIYFSAFQDGRAAAHNFSLRTTGDPAAFAGQVRKIVREALPGLPVGKVTTLDEQIDASIVPQRLIALLSGAFGLLAAVLAAIGLYGLLAYTVQRRIREIGVRMALGAAPGEITGMILQEALGMLLGGLVIGVPAAIAGGRLAASVVPGLTGGTVIPVVIAAAMMLGIAFVAAYPPARKAARVDPMESLRYE